MRNYWLKIFLGAFAIFAVGMIGVTMVRSGMSRVHEVVEGEGPLEIPLAFVPFVLSGERLGTLEHLVLERDEPRSVSAVELEVDLGDSLVAQGLAECRLAAHLESDQGEPGFNINVDTLRDDGSPFSCLAGDSVPAEFVEFGEVVFQPGEVRVPLYLNQEVVDELRKGFADDPDLQVAVPDADSLAEATRQQVDSALADANVARGRGRGLRRMGDSLRAVARARADSALAEARRVADSAPGR